MSIADRVTANIKRLTDAAPGNLQEQAIRCWPDDSPDAALRRLSRARGGDWPTPKTIDGLARGLEVDPAVFYGE